MRVLTKKMNEQNFVIPVGASATTGNRESGIRASGEICTVSRKNILKNDFTN